MDKPLCFFLLHFQLIESFTIYPDYITLRDKGIFIDIFYHSEYICRLVFLGKHYNYFNALFAIPSGTIQQGYSTA